jgi:hypothetical protein
MTGTGTYQHMKLQVEDLINCLQVMFVGLNFLMLFNQSLGHTKKQEDGLDTLNMNVEFGGKVSRMR